MQIKPFSLEFYMEKEIENRLIEIENALSIAEKYLDDLNQVVIEQGKQIDILQKQNKFLLAQLRESDIKPLSEETPPPHY